MDGRTDAQVHLEVWNVIVTDLEPPLGVEADLTKMIELRRLVRGQFVLEWGASDSALIDSLEAKLRAVYPNRQVPPVGVKGFPIVRTGALGKVAQLQPTNLTLTTEFTSNFQLHTDLAIEWVRKNWGSILKTFPPGMEPQFVALVFDVEMSTTGLHVSERAIIKRYVRAPPSFGELEDAEVRFCTAVDDRYFVNVGLSAYSTFILQVEQAKRHDEEKNQTRLEVRVEQTEKDNGLQIRLDVNTKVNQLRKQAPIRVDDRDLHRILGLMKEALDSSVPRLLREPVP